MMDDFKELGKILKTAIRTGLVGHVICVLDGLDQCDLKAVQIFAEWLCLFASEDAHDHGFSEISDTGTQILKSIVTTRGLPGVLGAFNPFPGNFLHISADEKEQADLLQKEIEAVMKAPFL